MTHLEKGYEAELIEELIWDVLVDVNHAEQGAYTRHINLLEQIRWDYLDEAKKNKESDARI
tara:strand:+ start:10336 stop:10518 length:183 start_codon:yes stop_codon:yes gene_type:complete